MSARTWDGTTVTLFRHSAPVQATPFDMQMWSIELGAIQMPASSLSDLAHSSMLGRIDALIRPFAGLVAVEQFPRV